MSRRWLQVAKQLKDDMADDHVTLIAAGVTFYTLLALFPLLAALVSIYGLVADPAAIQAHLDTLAGLAPGGTLDILREQLTKLASQDSQQLGLVFVGSLLISLWSGNKAMTAIFEAMNIAYDRPEQRGFIRRTAITLLFTLGAVLFVVVALAAIVVVPIVLDFLGLDAVWRAVASFARWPLLLLVVMVANALVYRYAPYRKHPRWVWVSWGSVTAALLWLVASALFSWYVANFGNFNETYGSLGSVVVLMMWIWISAVIVILGAELNAQLERSAEQTGDAGAAKPRQSGGEGLSRA